MNKRKVEQLKKIIPSLWNSYQHMYDVRRTGVQNKANFLLLVISFLSVISITLFAYFKNPLFFISFLLQLISFVVLLKTFFIKELKVHWFESKSLFNNLNNNEFYQDLFADLKALEEDTWIYMKNVEKTSRISLFILLFSLYSLLFLLFLMYFRGIILFPLVLILTFIFMLVVYIYYKRQPNFQYKSNYERYKGQIDEWLSK